MRPDPLAPAPAVNLERLRDLVGDAPAQWRTFLELFLESSGPVLADLYRGLGEADATIVRRAAHSLKGSAGSVGADEVAVLARQLEVAVGQRAWDLADSLRQRLDAALGRVARVAQTL